MKTIWKSVPLKLYSSTYEISNTGYIRSKGRWIIQRKNHTTYKRFMKSRILKPSLDRNGYLHIILSSHSHKKSVRLHRLVAKAFVPNPYKLQLVNHKNEIKTDNNANNLEWCTDKYNSDYGHSRIKMGYGHYKSVVLLFKNGIELYCPSIRKSASYLKSHFEIKARARSIASSIGKVVSHKLHSYKGIHAHWA